MFGPFFFNRNVNGKSYLNLLNVEIIPLMKTLFQNQFYENRFQRFWWIQVEILCHGLLEVRFKLNEYFGDRL